MSITFSEMNLVIGVDGPSIEDLNSIFMNNENQEEELFEFNESSYVIHREIVDDRYFWFYAEHGSPTPRGDTVLNVQSQEKEDNPRTAQQAELNKQLFAMYVQQEDVFYLSNTLKKKFFKKYLQSKVQRDVVIKNFLKTPDEFCKIANQIKSVRITAKRNIFNSFVGNMEIFEQDGDRLGLDDLPDKYILDVIFAGANMTAKFRKFLNEWFNSPKIDRLVCVGEDDEQFEAVFNSKSFTKKIEVELDKDEKGMYDQNEVREGLIHKLER